MKKIFFLAAAALMSLSAMATDLWTGSQAINWGEGGQIDIQATMFANAVAGQKIVVSYLNANDAPIEFKLPEVWKHVPGSREAWKLFESGTAELFLTEAAVAGLKQYGLQVCGSDFTATKVTLEDGKAEVLPGTIWTGFFWAADWTTLELYSEAYEDVDFSEVQSIRIYSEAKQQGNTDYLINIKSSWEEADHIAGKDQMTFTDDYAELVLDATMRAKLEAAKSTHLMIQFNREGAPAFNATAIVLVVSTPSALRNAEVANKTAKRIVNGQLVIERDGIRYNALGTSL